MGFSLYVCYVALDQTLFVMNTETWRHTRRSLVLMAAGGAVKTHLKQWAQVSMIGGFQMQSCSQLGWTDVLTHNYLTVTNDSGRDPPPRRQPLKWSGSRVDRSQQQHGLHVPYRSFRTDLPWRGEIQRSLYCQAGRSIICFSICIILEINITWVRDSKCDTKFAKRINETRTLSWWCLEADTSS